MVTIKADTANLTKNASSITKLTTAIKQLSDAVTKLKAANQSTKNELSSINNSINDYNRSIRKLRSTTAENLASIENTKKITSTITTLNRTKELTTNQLQQAKNTLAQTKNSRNLLCSAGL